MKSNLLSLEWWKAALVRALRTAIVIALPYFGGASLELIPWIAIASAAGLGFLASLVTSLAGLSEIGGQVSWYYAIGERVVKTFAQALAAGLVGAVFFADVDWSVVLQTSAIAAVGSLLLGFLTKLPEAELLPSAVQPVAALAPASTEVVETSSGNVITSTKTELH